MLVSGSMCMTHQALLNSSLNQMNSYCTFTFFICSQGYLNLHTQINPKRFIIRLSLSNSALQNYNM